tara:strand:+ start:592 stop:771 length:180 start_codon:yes stop_codon:yes gene_type:complete
MIQIAKTQPMLGFLIWQGRQDSNLGVAGSKPAALPLGYAPKIEIAVQVNTRRDKINCLS